MCSGDQMYSGDLNNGNIEKLTLTCLLIKWYHGALHLSSKEMGFYNPRSHLDSTVVTYCPMQLKNGGGQVKVSGRERGLP